MVEAQLLSDIHVRLLKKPFDGPQLIEELRALGVTASGPQHPESIG